MLFTVVNGLVAGYEGDRILADPDVTRTAEYRDWLADTHPDDFGSLVFQGTILVEEQTQIDRVEH